MSRGGGAYLANHLLPQELTGVPGERLIPGGAIPLALEGKGQQGLRRVHGDETRNNSGRVTHKLGRDEGGEGDALLGGRSRLHSSTDNHQSVP